MNTMYCKLDEREVVDRIVNFMKNTSKLPDVSVSEVSQHEDFLDLFEDFVSTRRRWFELSRILERAGWTRKRIRALYYNGPDYYTSKAAARWSPPNNEAT